MTHNEALAASASRLIEIQDVADRHGLPDHNWAEEILRGPDGVWAQAYQLREGRVAAITDVIYIPQSAA